MLPRAVDVIFNSIGGAHSAHQIRPTRLVSAEIIPTHEPPSAPIAPTTSEKSYTRDETGKSPIPNVLSRGLIIFPVLPISKQYEYAIWVSYLEIYNEKVYDLLDDPNGQTIAPLYLPPSRSRSWSSTNLFHHVSCLFGFFQYSRTRRSWWTDRRPHQTEGFEPQTRQRRWQQIRFRLA